MVGAIRLVSVERGHDPREFALVPFGGAGPAARRRARGAPRHAHHRGAAPPRRALDARAARHRRAQRLRADEPAEAARLRPRRGRRHLRRPRASRPSAWLDAEGVPPRAAPPHAARRPALPPPGLRDHGAVDRAATSSVDALLARFHERHRRLYTYALRGARGDRDPARGAPPGRVRRFDAARALDAAAARDRRRGPHRRARVLRRARGWVECPCVDAREPGRGRDRARARPSSSSSTPRPWCCRGQRATVDRVGNLVDPARGGAARGEARARRPHAARRGAAAPAGRSGDARDHQGRAARGPGGDGSGHRAHRDVAVHPREERLLRGHPRRAAAAWCAARWCPSSATSPRSSSRQYPPDDDAARAISTGTTTATARAAASRTRRTWSSPRRSSTDGELVAFSQTWGHFWDIGGLRAGSISPDATEIFHEGIIVPAVRIYRRGRAQRRGLPHLPAQLALPRHPARRHPRACWPAAGSASGASQELFERFGADHGAGGVGHLRASSAARRSRRRCESRMPDGTCESEDAVDGDGMTRPALPRAHAPHQGGRPDQHRHAGQRRPGAGARSTSSCTRACRS